jgi:2'-5' RNA ligase
MRLFIAIDLSEPVRQALTQLQAELRPVAESARWVAPGSIHLTLKFIGETQEQRIDEIDEALGALSWKTFTVFVRGIGFFPGNRSPRVLWAGLEASTMDGLAQQIDTRMERLGFEKEKRAFRPHLTLARARESRIDAALIAAASRYEDHDFGSFTVDRFHLFQSILKPEGAEYVKLKEYLLGPKAPL